MGTPLIVPIFLEVNSAWWCWIYGVLSLCPPHFRFHFWHVPSIRPTCIKLYVFIFCNFGFFNSVCYIQYWPCSLVLITEFSDRICGKWFPDEICVFLMPRTKPKLCRIVHAHESHCNLWNPWISWTAKTNFAHAIHPIGSTP